jgi:hypothetical protein
MKTFSKPTTCLLRTLGTAALGLLTLSACGSLDDDTAECEATYRVRFRYDMNMKYADAFSHEVRAVTLYVIDTDGNVVAREDADADRIDATDGTITLQGIKPGTYTFLAWCTTNQHHSYDLGEGSAITDLTCSVIPKQSGDDEVDYDLDGLYHGLVTNVVLPDSVGEHTYWVPLTKDNNRFRIVLQHIANKPLSDDQFEFALTDDNAYLDYANNVIPAQEAAPDDDDVLAKGPVSYTPWTTSSAYIDNEEAAAMGIAAIDDGVEANSVLAELSTSRLMANHSPRLTVRNTVTDSTIINIPVIDYIKLVMGYENRSMDLQDYLDRQDEYNMVFFIDESGNWLHTYIYINSWKVVPQNYAF